MEYLRIACKVLKTIILNFVFRFSFRKLNCILFRIFPCRGQGIQNYLTRSGMDPIPTSILVSSRHGCGTELPCRSNLDQNLKQEHKREWL